jgi:hypothetical protein
MRPTQVCLYRQARTKKRQMHYKGARQWWAKTPLHRALLDHSETAAREIN